MKLWGAGKLLEPPLVNFAEVYLSNWGKLPQKMPVYLFSDKYYFFKSSPGKKSRLLIIIMIIIIIKMVQKESRKFKKKNKTHTSPVRSMEKKGKYWEKQPNGIFLSYTVISWK